MGTRVISNKRLTLWLGPDTGIADYKAPKKAEIDAMTNVSEATKWDGFDFNLQGSEQNDDRSLTDAAGAQSRGQTQFGGSIAFFTPKPNDTSSILRKTRNMVKKPRTKLAVVVRTVTLNSQGAAVGEEVNAYRVITDTNAHQRGDVSYSYSINFRPQDDVGVNAIVAGPTATAVAVTPTGALSLAVGATERLAAEYAGVNITCGAEWASSDESVATVSLGGIVYGVKAGTADITAGYPGATASTAIVATVA